MQDLLNPQTFIGSVLSAATGVLLIAVGTYGVRVVQGWWQNMTHFRLRRHVDTPFDLREHIWADEKDDEQNLPIVIREPRGTVTLTLSSKHDWTGGPLEVVFVAPRLWFLPPWIPFNIRRARPRVSCRGVSVDVQMAGDFTIASSGYLAERAGAFRSSVMLTESAFIPADHEITIAVTYEARLSWSGLVAMRIRVDKRWMCAYYPVHIELNQDDAAVTPGSLAPLSEER